MEQTSVEQTPSVQEKPQKKSNDMIAAVRRIQKILEPFEDHQVNSIVSFVLANRDNG